MSLELLIEKYGYFALLVGTVLEGEIIVVLLVSLPIAAIYNCRW